MRNQPENNGAFVKPDSLRRTCSEKFIQDSARPDKLQHKEISYWNKNRLVYASTGQDAPYLKPGVIRNNEGVVVQEVLHFDDYAARAIKKNVKIASYLEVNLMLPFYAVNVNTLTYLDWRFQIPAIVVDTTLAGEATYQNPLQTPLKPLIFETMEPSENSVRKALTRPQPDKQVSSNEHIISARAQNSLFKTPARIQAYYSETALMPISSGVSDRFMNPTS